MNIASLVVYARPERTGLVAQRLEDFPEVEIHAVDDGRLVVTVEEGPERSLAEAIIGLQDLDDVLNAAMVFHFCEPPSEANPTHPGGAA